MTGERDLARMLTHLEPIARPGEYVVVTLPTAPLTPVEALIREGEGVTVVALRHVADAHGWAYEFIAVWITLQVHSALEGVGLTATVSTALAAEGIASNMLAGYFHDHLLVPADRRDDALEALAQLSARAVNGLLA